MSAGVQRRNGRIDRRGAALKRVQGKLCKLRWAPGAVLIGLLAFASGYLTRAGCSSAGPTAVQTTSVDERHAEESAQVWTCSMHPQIRLPEPGLCPICGMKLIPLPSAPTGGDGGERRFATSEAAKALMEIETRPVERRYVTAEIRMVGKIDYDETRLGYITAWVGGRLDRLFVDYTGVTVKEGDHMVSLYSPELLSAQEELLQAMRAAGEVEEGDVAVVRHTARATLEAARERLRLWGLRPDQIKRIEETGKALDHLTIHAPAGGVVIDKHVRQGMYVETGTRIYTIADLSRLWVMLDAYESDLVWLRYGQRVEFAGEAYPGERFTGRIAFIDPVLDARTRTVKVRVNVENPEGKLKPGMFVHAVVRAEVATGGRVMDPDLRGKWMCPMHPEIVKDSEGICDICEMDLVRTESLGYVAADPATKPLVIPSSAPLLTGRRSVVYVEVRGTDRPTFEGREVVLGPRAGDYYIVREGLAEGELVVTNGNFKIDSALQIQAKPSMMLPEGGVAPGQAHHGMAPQPPTARPAKREVPERFQEQIGDLWQAYLSLADALAGDAFEEAGQASVAMRKALDGVDMNLLTGDEHTAWMRRSGALGAVLVRSGETKDIESLRADFEVLSDEMLGVLRRFAGPSTGPVYRLRCPMASGGQGATWLQADTETRNPYFGAVMPRCGSVIETVLPPAAGSHDHE